MSDKLEPYSQRCRKLLLLVRGLDCDAWVPVSCQWHRVHTMAANVSAVPRPASRLPCSMLIWNSGCHLCWEYPVWGWQLRRFARGNCISTDISDLPTVRSVLSSVFPRVATTPGFRLFRFPLTPVEIYDVRDRHRDRRCRSQEVVLPCPACTSKTRFTRFWIAFVNSRTKYRNAPSAWSGILA
ncbi:hypothetical protein BJV77DRAFT_59587 [Russula vinacea]|nr:hypothetical protein BJV77DRAFT_59587 [Russula vinacea]